MPTPVPHLVVVIPGIGGSVLQRGDEDIWKLSLPVALRALFSRGRSIEELVPDDPALLDDPDFDDGIHATGLIESPVSLPGLARLGGYEGLRRSLHEHFELDELNYIEFAYDWRRDLRISAQRLADTVDARLAELDEYVGRAEVIAIAHSMGGLVARHWLGELGGAERCRGLITLGTPYRGSPKTVRMLTGGYVWKSVGSSRFAELLRALPAVHQLLPIYPCIHDLRSGELARVIEVAGDLAGVDADRAAQARVLLTALNDSAQPGLTSVIGGTGQATLQTISLDEHGVSFPNDALPENFGLTAATDGDSTVPWVAARPLDYANVRGLTPTFTNQTHGGLSREGSVLSALRDRLAHLLVEDDPARSPFEPPPSMTSRSPGDSDDGEDQPRLGFDLDDDHVEGEPIDLTVVTGGLPEGTTISVTVDGHPVGSITIDGAPAHHVTIEPMEAGAYTVTAEPTSPVPGAGQLTVLDTIDVWPA